MATRNSFNVKKLRSLFNNHVERALTEVANNVINTAKNILTDERHVATGDIRDNFDFEIKRQEGRGVVLRIFNRSPDAIFAEFGRRPGQRPPPPEPIRLWLDAKGLPSDDKTVYLVGQKIARDGIPAMRFMSRAFIQNEAQAKESVGTAIQTAVDQLRVK